MLTFSNLRLTFVSSSTSHLSNPMFRGGSMAFMSSVENRKTMLIFINFALLVISLLLIGGLGQLRFLNFIHLSFHF